MSQHQEFSKLAGVFSVIGENPKTLFLFLNKTAEGEILLFNDFSFSFLFYGSMSNKQLVSVGSAFTILCALYMLRCPGFKRRFIVMRKR